MQLLDSTDFEPASHGRDSRWTVASVLFNRLYDLQGTAALPDIRREALSLGDRGVYPFLAIASLLNQVQTPDVVSQFFGDALDYFRRSGTNRTQVFGLLSLMSSDRVRKQVQPWQLQEAASAIAADVKDYARSQNDLQAEGESIDPNISSFLRYVQASLKRIAPEVAAQLPSPSSFPAGSGYLLSVNSNTQGKRPVAPVPDDSLKTLQKAFEASRTAMMKLGEDEVHEGPEMQQTIDRTVGLGAEVVDRTVLAYAPEDHDYAMLVSTTELSGVARLGAHINPAATLSAIRQIQDDELRTKLLLAVARTIQYLR
jgi:hypothetical protein